MLKHNKNDNNPVYMLLSLIDQSTYKTVVRNSIITMVRKNSYIVELVYGLL